MAFDIEWGKVVPKGKLVPMYLTDEGDLFPLVLDNEDQLNRVATAIDNALDNYIVVDTRTMINDPTEKLVVNFEIS